MFCGSFNKIVLSVSPVLVKTFPIKLVRYRLYIKLYKICFLNLIRGYERRGNINSKKLDLHYIINPCFTKWKNVEFINFMI